MRAGSGGRELEGFCVAGDDSMELVAGEEKMVLVAGEDGKRGLYLALGRRNDIEELEVLLMLVENQNDMRLTREQRKVRE
jgi:hypothetical protein